MKELNIPLSPASLMGVGCAGLEADLLALRSPDVLSRLHAFHRLRGVPRDDIAAAYYRVRWRPPAQGRTLDCLERLEVEPPDPPIVCDRCICTVVSPGYEPFLEALLDTLARFGQAQEAHVVVFAINETYETLAGRTDVICIRCHSRERLSPAVKGVIYSAARFVHADYILAVEVDMLVVGSLQPLWALLDTASPAIMLGARVQRERDIADLRTILTWMEAPESDLAFLTGRSDFNGRFWFNGGVLAGGREAFLALDAQMRRLCPWAILFVEGAFRFEFTDEFAMNACVGLLEMGAELAPEFNVQVYDRDLDRWLERKWGQDGLTFRKDGAAARVIHFTSPARELLWQVKADIDCWGLAPGITPLVQGSQEVAPGIKEKE